MKSKIYRPRHGPKPRRFEDQLDWDDEIEIGQPSEAKSKSKRVHL
jgi:hypothetical protein